MTSTSIFWLVWSPTGVSAPRVRHLSETEATNAAVDMANRYPSQEFFVLQAKSRSKSIAVTTTKLTDMEIPF